MEEGTFIRYLAAKRSVDDRALNRRVWDAMVEAAGRTAVSAGRRSTGGALPAARPRVLELGGGIGTMIERVVEDGRLLPASWALLDSSPALLREARHRIGGSLPFPVDYLESTVDAFLDSAPRQFELTVANAVLDLLDLPRVLPRLAGRGSGLFYFTINFDGVTVLEPAVDADLDERVVALYHRTMDERIVDGIPSGDSRCGRHLLSLLPRCGFRIIEAGSSDWIVHPRDGAYPADERFFLSCILDFFEQSLSERDEIGAEELSRWLQVRRRQLADGELVFIAHQIDVLAETGGSP
jgi:SAM-dependent methyltransferase